MSAGEAIKPVQWPSELSPAHRKQLEASGITAEVAVERGYFTVTAHDKARLRKLGFEPFQIPKSGDTLVLPIRDVHGNVAGHYIRPDEPRPGRKGKKVKYDVPKGFNIVIDVPPRSQPALGNRDVPIVVTEGQKKGDAGVSAASAESKEICLIDLAGIWCWCRGKDERDANIPLPDWDKIELKDRLVYIIFDNDPDPKTKRKVRQARVAFKAFLESRGTKVKVISLPAKGDKKVGLDDHLVAGHTIEQVLALATDDPDSVPTEAGDRQVGQYLERKTGLYRIDDFKLIRLTNYTARILVDMAPRRWYRD